MALQDVSALVDRYIECLARLAEATRVSEAAEAATETIRAEAQAIRKDYYAAQDGLLGEWSKTFGPL